MAANTIQIDTETLQRISAALSGLGTSLNGLNSRTRSAAAEVRNVAPECEAVIRNLEKIDKRFTAATTRVETLSRNVATVAEMWKDCENGIISMIMADSVSSDKNGDAGTADDANKDSRKLAAELADEYMQMMLRNMQNVPPPEDTIAYMKRSLYKDGIMGFINQFANGAWSLISGDWMNIGQNPETYRHYLRQKALEYMLTGEAKIIAGDTDPINRAFSALEGEEGTLELIMEAAEKNDLDALCKLINDHDTNTALMDMLESDAYSSVDMLKGLAKVNNYLKVAKVGKDGIISLVDVYNQYQILNSLDPARLQETARVYMASEDANIRAVGDTLSKLANASDAERIGMIAGGELADFGLKTACDLVADKAATMAGGPIVQTARITASAMDVLTGVNDVPGLQNELGFSVQAAESSYQVLQQDLAAYNANPTEENFLRAKASYEVYCENCATANDAAANLHEVSEKGMITNLSDAQRAEMNACRQTAESYKNRVNTMEAWDGNRKAANEAAKTDGDLSKIKAL